MVQSAVTSGGEGSFDESAAGLTGAKEYRCEQAGDPGCTDDLAGHSEDMQDAEFQHSADLHGCMGDSVGSSMCDEDGFGDFEGTGSVVSCEGDSSFAGSRLVPLVHDPELVRIFKLLNLRLPGVARA